MESTELFLEVLVATAIFALVANVSACLYVVLFWQGRRSEKAPAGPAPPPARPLAPSKILRPKTAAVRPRFVNPQTGDVFPLEDELRPLIATRTLGAVRIIGGPGAGKTTAIEHLMAVLPDEPRPWYLDDPDPEILSYFATKYLMIYTSEEPASDADRFLDLASYRLARWDRDDLIEYLLSAHEQACGSVMKRVGSASPLAFGGRPEIWRPILDTLAADPAIPDARRALSNYLQWLVPDLEEFQAAGRMCLDELTLSSPAENPEFPPPKNEFESLLRHREVQILVAAEQLAQMLQGPVPPNEIYLARHFPKPVVEETAAILSEDPPALLHVVRLLEQPIKNCSLLVSLLHIAKVHWPPAFHCDPDLSFAYLAGIRWPGVELSAAKLFHADFCRADMNMGNLDAAVGERAKFRGANLSGASMIGSEFVAADFRNADLSWVKAEDSCFEHARFRRANLQSARLPNCVFTNADLKNANLSNANLTGAFLSCANLTEACLAGANLSLARLLDATLDHADFTGANLEGSQLKGRCLRGTCLDDASFRNADMEFCQLEDLRAKNVNFESANLNHAAFTGSQFANARFSFACLRGAKLADIHWEGANLSYADLQGATFHMGSTRSGLLFTGIASEGTRTGFYTDEFEEQSFRAPEEIRKANLCGADLRGALISNVDFYLVDLRGALYDAEQAEHFRRCGAIL